MECKEELCGPVRVRGIEWMARLDANVILLQLTAKVDTSRDPRVGTDRKVVSELVRAYSDAQSIFLREAGGARILDRVAVGCILPNRPVWYGRRR